MHEQGFKHELGFTISLYEDLIGRVAWKRKMIGDYGAIEALHQLALC